MTPQQAVAIFVRFSSIWFLILCFQAFGANRAVTQVSEISSISLFTTLIVAVYLALAFICWLIPMRIAHFLIPNTRFDNVIKLQPFQSIYVACVVLGLWTCVIEAIPLISIYGSSLILMADQGHSVSTLTALENQDIFSGIIQLVIGLVLIIKAEFISKKILSFHSASEND